MDLKEIVQTALQEDIGSGDWTTRLLITPKTCGSGKVVAKSDGILSGIVVFTEVFRQLDESIIVHSAFSDGQAVSSGDVIMDLEGSIAALLAGERVALNFLQRLSGIATLTRSFVEAVRGTGTTILDTRKTTPGLRLLEKAAVLHGGGKNHRQGLYDMILIKDNHIFSCGGISAALKRAFTARKEMPLPLPVEIEVKDLEELAEALLYAHDLERIMLDNFTVSMVREGVLRTGKRAPLEVSGGVTLKNVREFALTGVEYLSVGALTHSAPALDLSLLITA
jgi:nicotinate-nucleotide pyrophosphorylase (carboxylating)